MLSTPSAFISIPDVVPFVALVDDHQQRIEEVGRRGGSGIADAVGRLTESSERRGDNDALTYQQTFNFDRFGNMYRKAANNNPTGQANPLPYTAIEDADISKATNRFTADTTYDEAGNVTVDDKFRDLGYSYDANGRMVKATKAATPDASSVYDASGMRVAEKVNDVWRFLIYDIGGKCIAEYGGAASTDEGGVKYPLKDWQGSTRGSISNTGNVQSRQDFTAFGEEIGAGTGLRTSGQGFGASDTLREKYGLTERDDATGLDHTWFRKHENQAGRWTSPDPYNGSMSLGSSQSFNRYSYVENQPTNFVDPSGLMVDATTSAGGYCIRYHYTNGVIGYWGPWTCYGGENVSIAGGGGGGGGVRIPDNCVNAIKELGEGVWEKVKSMFLNPPLINVDKHEFESSVGYFNSPLSLGSAFDSMNSNAVTTRFGDMATILYRESRYNIRADAPLLLHEILHVLYPPNNLLVPNTDLDLELVVKWGLTLDEGMTDAEAIDNFLKNNCDPNLRAGY